VGLALMHAILGAAGYSSLVHGIFTYPEPFHRLLLSKADCPTDRRASRHNEQQRNPRST